MISEDILQDAVHALKEGHPVVFPTETVYGIGIAASQKKHSGMIYDLKGREETKPLSLHIGDLDLLNGSQIYFPRVNYFLMHRFWPGPLTLVIKKRSGEKMGYRFPSHKIFRRLVEMLGEPVLATSANKSGQAPALSLAKAREYFGEAVSVYLEGGTPEFQGASTVLDTSQYPPAWIREGARAKEIRAALEEFEAMGFLKKKILIACSGNTCRSPMAEGWLRKYLQEKGWSDSFEVHSAGTAALAGLPPSQEAIEVMEEEHIDISQKRARPIHRELIRESNIIFVMTAGHKDTILEQVSDAENKVHILDIPDPVGMDREQYRKTFELIRERILKEMTWLLKL